MLLLFLWPLLEEKYFVIVVQSFSHAQLFVTPWTAACQASLSFTNSHSLLKFMSTKSLMLFNHFILYCSLLHLYSVFSSIRIFSNELTPHIRWPKYYRFSISPSSEYSGLISLRIDWFNLLAIQRTLKSTSAPQLESISSSALNHFYCPTVIPQSQGCPAVHGLEDSSPGQGITALAEGRQTHWIFTWFLLVSSQSCFIYSLHGWGLGKTQIHHIIWS